MYIRSWRRSSTKLSSVSSAAKLQPPEEYKGPKLEYWHRSSGYRKIVKKNEGPILLARTLNAQISAVKTSIIANSLTAKFARLLLYAYIATGLAVFVGVAHFLKSVQKVGSVPLILLALGVVFLMLAGCYRFLDEKYLRLTEVIISRHRSQFQNIEFDLNDALVRSQQAEQAILAEWDRYCVNYDKYPPDWDERKALVMKRDGCQCTDCGWPSGHQVRRRNLHVHHITRLSADGDNSIENLTTLCHICHRKQEGSGHKRIKYRVQNKR